MFVSLSAALVQACGFGEDKQRRTALWWRRGMDGGEAGQRRGGADDQPNGP